jgi:hypothetical protein
MRAGVGTARGLAHLALAVGSLAIPASESFAAARTYTDPVYLGDPVHRCLTNKTACGKPAADAFCRLEGYDNALSFQVMKDVSRVATARTIDTGTVLIAPEAHPFQLVKCWRPSQAPSSVTFQARTVEGIKIPSMCDIGQDCRKSVADGWCIGRGFNLGATGYELAPTRLAFRSISCATL